MAEKKNILSYEGLKELEDELQELKVNKRQEVAQKLKEARAQGDLSENAEVFDEEESEAATVNFGSNVVLHDIDMDEVVEYKIVGSTEANFLKGKISNESPLGAAIMRKKIGDVVTVEAPDGEFQYKILDIRKK